MSGLSTDTVYRGKEGCLPPKEAFTKPIGSGRRGGTVGAGTRQGTHRSHLQQLAYDVDVDGLQLRALKTSLDVYFDQSARAALCYG